MNRQRLFATFWLVLLFGSGLVVGMTFSPLSAHGVGFLTEEKDVPTIPEQRWVEHHRQLLLSELDLSEEQLVLIDSVYARSSGRLRKLREAMAVDIKEVIRENRRGLAKILTPEQVEQFKEFQLVGKEGPQT